MDYIISTDDLQEASLTAHIDRENALRVSSGLAPWPDTQAYVEEAALRLIFDPVVALFKDATVQRLVTQARKATLTQLQAADAALPD